MDGEGNYIEYDRPDEQDAWLDSIEGGAITFLSWAVGWVSG